MANPNPKGHLRWKKGQSGNPKGSSKRAKEIGRIARMTSEQIAEIGAALLAGTVADLQLTSEDPESTALQAWTAKLVIHSMFKGDVGVYRAVLDRIAGKVPESMQHSGLGGKPIELQMTTKERRARLVELEMRRKHAGYD